jgi:acyl-CoA dehydrogenase
MAQLDLKASEKDADMYHLSMSEEAMPLLAAVKKFCAEEVAPIADQFYKLGEDRKDRWSWAPGQLELLDKAKSKAKKQGLWNFFLPDAETGEGLKNLDYAYIAAELGRQPLASECLNCSAPDTGNMEVLERVGTPEQKEKWLKPLLNGEIRSCFGMTEPHLASSDAQNIGTRAELVGDEWVINGEKYYISGAGDPRCKIMICMVKTSPNASRHRQQSQILVPMNTPGLKILGPMTVFGHDDAPHGHMHIKLDNVRVPKGEHPAWRRPRLRDFAGTPRTGPNPPLHAVDRPGRARARPDDQAHDDARSVRQTDHSARQEPRDRVARADRDRSNAVDGAARGTRDGRARQSGSAHLGAHG